MTPPEVRQQMLDAQAKSSQPQEQAKGPSESIAFKDLPNSGKVQMAKQAGIALDPSELIQKDIREEQQFNAKLQPKQQLPAM